MRQQKAGAEPAVKPREINVPRRALYRDAASPGDAGIEAPVEKTKAVRARPAKKAKKVAKRKTTR